MKNHLTKLALLIAVAMVLIVSCSKEGDKTNAEPFTAYYNFKDTYNEELLLKIANSEGTVSYYGSTNELGKSEILASLYKNNATGRRIIYKTNSTRDTAIVYDFDKPDFGGILTIRKGNTILVQEFEFLEDNKSIKPTHFIKSISKAANRLQQINRNSSDNFFDNILDDILKDFIDENQDENQTDDWFGIDIDNPFKGMIDDFKKSWNDGIDYLKNKINKNPEPIQKEIAEDPEPDPNIDPVKPFNQILSVDCKTVKNGNAFIDNCDICVEIDKGEKPCDCNNSTLAITVTTTASSATVQIIGGQPPYEIWWSNGSTGNTASNLTPGKNYLLEVKDKLGCTKSITINIEDVCKNSTLAVITSTTINSATADALGGTPPYKSYEWSNGDKGATATNLEAGTYTVTVTDNQGCIVIGTAVVGVDNIIGTWNLISNNGVALGECDPQSAVDYCYRVFSGSINIAETTFSYAENSLQQDINSGVVTNTSSSVSGTRNGLTLSFKDEDGVINELLITKISSGKISINGFVFIKQ